MSAGIVRTSAVALTALCRRDSPGHTDSGRRPLCTWPRIEPHNRSPNKMNDVVNLRSSLCRGIICFVHWEFFYRRRQFDIWSRVAWILADGPSMCPTRQE